jgi:hypothetical protein
MWLLIDEAVEQGAQHVLLEVPAIDGSPDVVGYFPNLALQSCALLNTRHSEALLFGVNWGCLVWLSEPRPMQASISRPRLNP